jgi:hypothetical protein
VDSLLLSLLSFMSLLPHANFPAIAIVVFTKEAGGRYAGRRLHSFSGYGD